MNSKRVSIILACYEARRDFLEAQLESIAAQTLLPHELIVSDDVSSNGTAEFVQEICRRLRLPLKMVQQSERQGYSRNFLSAAKHAVGEIIFFSDQDDVWYPNKVEKVLSVFAKTPQPLVVIHDQKRVWDDLTPQGRTTLEAYLGRGMTHNAYVHGCATAFDSRLLPVFAQCPDSYAYDEWIHFVGNALARRKLLEQELMLFRRHAGSTTTRLSATKKKVSPYFRLLERCRKYREFWLSELDRQLVGIKILIEALDKDSPIVDHVLDGDVCERIEEFRDHIRSRQNVLQSNIITLPGALIKTSGMNFGDREARRLRYLDAIASFVGIY